MWPHGLGNELPAIETTIHTGSKSQKLPLLNCRCQSQFYHHRLELECDRQGLASLQWVALARYQSYDSVEQCKSHRERQHKGEWEVLAQRVQLPLLHLMSSLL